ncbi:hypothetical protein [Propionicicella superfundia]|uniref:hypothetical protein n=1 Tax=Propionicicella superfundia TaxID=348582 RepID=UPI00040679ED|nr:hypothetical protein [Propionicicella superfundia]
MSTSTTDLAAASAFAVIGAGAIASATPAHAGPVSISGDSNWRVSAQSTVSTHYPRVGNTVTATATMKYNAQFLGLPVPVTGYYTQTFPTKPFATPTLVSVVNADLYRRHYVSSRDTYVGSSAWVVSGQSTFWGSKTVTIKASAKARSKGSSGYVHGGTGRGHSIDANSIDYIKVS